MSDVAYGLWLVAAAITYPLAIVVAERRYGMTGLVIAALCCALVQCVVELSHRKRVRRQNAEDAAEDEMHFPG